MSGERSGDADELGQQGRLRLPSLGRILGEPLADLVAAAAFLRRVLPEIAADLAAIRSHVGSMDPEMVGMHASVERIEGEMGDLNARIGDLAERMAAVERAVVRLEPHVADDGAVAAHGMERVDDLAAGDGPAGEAVRLLADLEAVRIAGRRAAVAPQPQVHGWKMGPPTLAPPPRT